MLSASAQSEKRVDSAAVGESRTQLSLEWDLQPLLVVSITVCHMEYSLVVSRGQADFEDAWATLLATNLHLLRQGSPVPFRAAKCAMKEEAHAHNAL
jgi:hypothetical protein